MSRVAILLFSVAITSAFALCQNREIELNGILERPFDFRPDSLRGLGWRDAENYTFFEGRGPSLRWMGASVKSGAKEKIADVASLREILKGAELGGLNARHLAAASWTPDSRARLIVNGQLVHIDLDSGKATLGLTVPVDAEATAWAPGDRCVAWSKEKDIHVRGSDGKIVRVTHDGYRHLTHGLAVHRVEFGITDGMWWDPTGRRLAFYREDLRPIERYPASDFAPRPAKDLDLRYPMAGRNGSVVSIGIFDTRDGSLRWLETDPAADEWHTNVTWAPDGESLYVAHVNRKQNAMELRRWSAVDGKRLGTLFEEKDSEWIEPEHGPIFLPDGSGRFLWFSHRSGFNHLHLHSADGAHEFQVTGGAFDVNEFLGFDPTGAKIRVHASGRDPRQNHLFECALTKPVYGVEETDAGAVITESATRMRQVTGGRGQHRAMLSPDGAHALDTHSNLEHPGKVDLIGIDGRVIRTLHESKNPLDGLRTGRESFFETKTEDGQPLYGHQILPPEFEEGESYPVLVYVYSGPHSQFVRDEWMGGLGTTNLWLHHMATQGMIVLRTDGRGTANRGIEWAQCIHRRLGTCEINDQIAGLDHILENYPGDPDRVGVTGWSYGGFMTLSLMTRAGDRFAAGVAGAPVTDWRYYETGYGERYMDRPAENEEGYDNSDPARHVKGIKGRLLVVHGTSDETVVLQHSMHFLDACIDAGKEVEFFAYPGQLHGLRGRDRQHFYRKMTGFFLQTLSVNE